jgi:hypothetical protein
MNGSSLAAALPRTPAIQPDETVTPVMALISSAARATGTWWAVARLAAWACTSGPYCARPVIPAGGRPAVTVPHRSHIVAWTRYSVTRGGGGGTISNSCSLCTPTAHRARQALPAPAALRRGAYHRLIGIADLAQRGRLRARPLARLVPGPAPQRPVPGLLLCGLSDDGGLEDVEESLPRRLSSSATRSLSAVNRASAASKAAWATASCASLASITSRSRALAPRSSATCARSSSSTACGG